MFIESQENKMVWHFPKLRQIDLGSTQGGGMGTNEADNGFLSS
mgnify:CR=1 FL=1